MSKAWVRRVYDEAIRPMATAERLWIAERIIRDLRRGQEPAPLVPWTAEEVAALREAFGAMKAAEGRPLAEVIAERRRTSDKR